MQLRVIWQVGALAPVGDLAIVGRANARHEDHLDESGYSAVTTTLVVKTLHADNRADVAFVYTLQPQHAPPVACAFVDATVPLGRPVAVTGTDGQVVTLTVLLPAPSGGPDAPTQSR